MERKKEFPRINRYWCRDFEKNSKWNHEIGFPKFPPCFGVRKHVRSYFRMHLFFAHCTHWAGIWTEFIKLDLFHLFIRYVFGILIIQEQKTAIVLRTVYFFEGIYHHLVLNNGKSKWIFLFVLKIPFHGQNSK